LPGFAGGKGAISSIHCGHLAGARLHGDGGVLSSHVSLVLERVQ
jgi:hypothetical protein